MHTCKYVCMHLGFFSHTRHIIQYYTNFSIAYVRQNDIVSLYEKIMTPEIYFLWNKKDR